MSTSAQSEALGQGLPVDWTVEARVQTLLDSYLSSAKSTDAIKSFKDFAAETPGFFDKVVVCALRTALGCQEKQQKMVTDLLGLLYKEQVLDRPSLVLGYATLICTWQVLPGESLVYLAEMLLTCIRSGCIAEEFLTRLPEGFLTAVLLDERAKDTKELENARDRLHHFKQVIEDNKLLGTPLPHIDTALSVLKEQATPDCRHEFVKRGLTASLAWHAVLALMDQLMEKGILTKEDFQWGVLNLLGQLEDTVDCPDVAKIAEHLRELLDKDLLTTNFVLRCRMLSVGGEAGLKVLDALEPPSAPPVNLSKANPQSFGLLTSFLMVQESPAPPAQQGEEEEDARSSSSDPMALLEQELGRFQMPGGGDLPNQMAMAGVAPPEVPAMDGVAPVAVMQQAEMTPAAQGAPEQNGSGVVQVEAAEPAPTEKAAEPAVPPSDSQPEKTSEAPEQSGEDL